MSGAIEPGPTSWTLGIAGIVTAIASGLLGHVHWRINQEREESREDLQKIRDKLDEHGAQFLAIAKDGATKQDIRDLIAEIHQLRLLLESMRKSL